MPGDSTWIVLTSVSFLLFFLLGNVFFVVPLVLLVACQVGFDSPSYFRF